MRIAKIVRSNSHVDYVARVFGQREIAEDVTPNDYRFGQFVKIAGHAGAVVGVIYNSFLLNSAYGDFGPRLSTSQEQNAIFSPDYLNEQGVLIGLLLVGWHDGQRYQQGLSREVLPINADVETLSDEEVRAFHHTAANGLELKYYNHVTTHAGYFTFQLLSTIVDQLEGLCEERDRARLQVLRKSLAWQQTMATMR
ncbi:MAG: hypothetical protein HYR56_00175 [Acidobacteria bacterium]|nr:hypothetical protein [Acidobacteriota bacterium]MBI3423229.1 hypothetical protein [Acidobacteriota bacterium]